MGVFVDISPLREHPEFRRIYAGQLVSVIGSMFTLVALQYQAYKLGGDSTSTVALLAAVTLVPFVGTSIVGGAIADSHDRRTILIITQARLALCSLTLALNALSSHPKLWVVFAVGIVLNGLVGIDGPTRSSLVPTLVPRSETQKALALTIALFNIGGIAGPVLAAFLVRRHTPALYLFDAASFAVAFLAVASIRARPPAGERRTVSFETIAGGFRYVKANRLIQSTFVADLGAMIFGLPDALFPAFAEHVFHDTRTLGYLKAAPAIGALSAGALSGWTHRIARQGRAVIVCICVWGVGVALFGATKTLPVALVGLFVAGAADSISALFRSTIVQTTVPDEYRGRLSSIFVAVVRGGPKLGETESGVAARLGGLQFAAVSGGLACLVWIALVAVLYPELRSWESSFDPPVAETDPPEAETAIAPAEQ
jgi:MFS family permease